MKDKNLNILSSRTSNALLYMNFNCHSSLIVLIWAVNIRNINCANIIFIEKASLSSFKQYTVISP